MTRLENFIIETLGAPSPGHPQGWQGFGAPLGAQIVPPISSFPYRTRTAEVVWDMAKQLVPLHPELDERQIMALALQKSGVQAVDLTPEDWRLLEIAIESRKNGTLGLPKPRIGGSPGGPYNTGAEGAFLPKLGYR